MANPPIPHDDHEVLQRLQEGDLIARAPQPGNYDARHLLFPQIARALHPHAEPGGNYDARISLFQQMANADALPGEQRARAPQPGNYYGRALLARAQHPDVLPGNQRARAPPPGNYDARALLARAQRPDNLFALQGALQYPGNYDARRLLHQQARALHPDRHDERDDIDEAVLDSDNDEASTMLAAMSCFPRNRGPRVLNLARRLERESRLPTLAVELRESRILSLNLEGNLLTDTEVCGFASSLKDTVLQSLNLAHNRITHLGVEALAAGLKDSQIQHLCLAQNRLSDNGALLLAAVLTGTRLQSLGLADNFIGDEGATAVAEGMKNSRLECLDLADNNIGDEGACSLFLCLKELSIRSLRLASNRIGRVGVRQLAQVVKESALNFLDLSSNLIGPDMQALVEALQDSVVIGIALHGNNISEQTSEEIDAIVQTNKARSFVLQMEAQRLESIWTLAFRTLGGSVAAEVQWTCDQQLSELPEAVYTKLRTTKFPVPKTISVAHLKLVLPNGGVLDTGPNAAPLAQQLGIPAGPAAVPAD